MSTIVWQGDFDGFRDRIRELAETTMRGLAPHEDPPPQLCLYRPPGKAGPREGAITAIEIPAQWLQSSATKVGLIDRVVLPLCNFGVRYVAITTSSWAVRSDSPAGQEVERRAAAGEPIPWLPDLELEGVGEDFAVWAIAETGAVGLRAPIQRTAIAPPTLGEWEDVGTVTGRWADPIVTRLAALK